MSNNIHTVPMTKLNAIFGIQWSQSKPNILWDQPLFSV